MIDPNVAIVAAAMMGLTFSALRLSRRIDALTAKVGMLDRTQRILARRA